MDPIEGKYFFAEERGGKLHIVGGKPKKEMNAKMLLGEIEKHVTLPTVIDHSDLKIKEIVNSTFAGYQASYAKNICACGKLWDSFREGFGWSTERSELQTRVENIQRQIKLPLDEVNKLEDFEDHFSQIEKIIKMIVENTKNCFGSLLVPKIDSDWVDKLEWKNYIRQKKPEDNRFFIQSLIEEIHREYMQLLMTFEKSAQRDEVFLCFTKMFLPLVPLFERTCRIFDLIASHLLFEFSEDENRKLIAVDLLCCMMQSQEACAQVSKRSRKKPTPQIEINREELTQKSLEELCREIINQFIKIFQVNHAEKLAPLTKDKEVIQAFEIKGAIKRVEENYENEAMQNVMKEAIVKFADMQQGNNELAKSILGYSKEPWDLCDRLINFDFFDAASVLMQRFPSIQDRCKKNYNEKLRVFELKQQQRREQKEKQEKFDLLLEETFKNFDESQLKRWLHAVDQYFNDPRITTHVNVDAEKMYETIGRIPERLIGHHLTEGLSEKIKNYLRPLPTGE